MNHADQVDALEAARRAGIDLDLLDSNLALSVKERWLRHDEALGMVRAYEKELGFELPEDAIIWRTKLGVELRYRLKTGQEIQCVV